MKRLKVLVLFLCTLHSSLCTFSQRYVQREYPASVIEDAALDIEPLVRKYGYPIETHYVTTDDGYILTVHRLARPNAPVIFLMHGLLDSSITWVITGPWSGLAYYLYDEGYDVWMGNARGNFYSRNHSKYNPDSDVEFWSFSWHEIGLHDLPAMIDYVLESTGRRKLGYVGHSQGTTSFFVMTSSRPDYNRKISMMSALAPVAFMKHIKTPLLFLLRNLISIYGDRLYEFLPRTQVPQTLCLPSPVAQETCTDVIYQIFGKDPKMWNNTMIPAIFSKVPSGCNFKQILHYVQLIDSGRFCAYDYGPDQNQKIYGQRTPKDYRIAHISAPIGLYYTDNDFLSSEVDVATLLAKLPNVAEGVLYKRWNHMTLVWGVDARQKLYKRMLRTMRLHE